MRSIPIPAFTVTHDPDPTEDDRLITKDELAALQAWMRSDVPTFDEAPTLDEAYRPTDADARWWARQSAQAVPSDLDLWLDDDREPALPELSDDHTDALSGWTPGLSW